MSSRQTEYLTFYLAHGVMPVLRKPWRNLFASGLGPVSYDTEQAARDGAVKGVLGQVMIQVVRSTIQHPKVYDGRVAQQKGVWRQYRVYAAHIETKWSNESDWNRLYFIPLRDAALVASIMAEHGLKG